MTRLWLAGGVLVAALGTAQQPERPFSTSSELVVVPAIVVDRRGEPVTDLTEGDFEVREDGKVVTLSTFVAASGPTAGAAEARFIVLVLDDLGTSADLAWRVKDIASRFVKRMSPRDVVTVIRLNGDGGTSSSDPEVVRAAINRFRVIGPSVLTGRSLLDHALTTISELAEQMAESPHLRKVMVAIGSAGLFNPYVDPETSMPEYGPWLDAIRRTARRNVSVYVIDPRGGANLLSGMGMPASSGGSPPGGQSRLTFPDGAGGLAAQTGGEAYVRTNDFERAVRRIWTESATYYLLGYAPPVNDERVHRIDVHVKRSGVTVRARRARS